MSGRIRKVELKDGSTKFYPYIRYEGKEWSLKGFSTERNAETALRRAEVEIANGVFKQPKKPKKKDPTFAAWVEKWLASKEKSLKPSTYASYESAFKTHITPFFKGKRLSEINNETVEEWVAWVQTQTIRDGGKKPISNATISKLYRYLRACLRRAYRRGYIAEYPCIDIDLPRVRKPEIVWLNEDEIIRLLDAADEPERTLFAILGLSGLRLGECLALRWQDINFKMNAIMVTRSWSQWNGFDEPKSEDSNRAVPVLPVLKDILKAHGASRGKPADNDLLFPGVGERPLDPKTLQGVFAKTLEKAKLKTVTMHSLRHSFATMYLGSGATIKDVQEVLGHSDAALTMRVYAKVLQSNRSESMAKMNALLVAKAEGKVKNIKSASGN